MGQYHQLGLHYYDKDDYETALQYFLKAYKFAGTSDEDKASCLYFLGFMYRHGQGVDKDPIKAIIYFEKSIELGGQGACYNLAAMYYNGKVVLKDFEKARKYYEIGAERGSLNCLLNLGIMYDEGVGVDMDKAKAFELFEKATQLGDIDATYNLAVMHEYGESVPKNKGVAMRYYCEAGEYPMPDMGKVITLKRDEEIDNKCPYIARKGDNNTNTVADFDQLEELHKNSRECCQR